MRKTEAEIKVDLQKAADEKRLVTCMVPGGGDLSICLERHMVEEAMASWRINPDEGSREGAMASIRAAIKRTVKRMKQKRATGKEMDDLAADIALWLGHELVFADGEKHLIKGPEQFHFETN